MSHGGIRECLTLARCFIYSDNYQVKKLPINSQAICDLKLEVCFVDGPSFVPCRMQVF